MVSLVGTRSGRTGHNLVIIFTFYPFTWPPLNLFSLSDPSFKSTMGFCTEKRQIWTRGVQKRVRVRTPGRVQGGRPGGGLKGAKPYWKKGPISPRFRSISRRKATLPSSIIHVNGHGWQGMRERQSQVQGKMQTINYHDHLLDVEKSGYIGKKRWS